MGILLTGVTGFLGSYIAAEILTRFPSERLLLLIRSRNIEEAERRLWEALQLHFDFSTFLEFRKTRIDFFLGDVTRPDCGLNEQSKSHLIRSADSVIHCAAALNRRSSEACMNVNLRGTLEVVKIAQAIDGEHGLRRFSNISSVAVAGRRRNETVSEDRAIHWTAPDADPYGQTKKFAEHMARRLLPESKVVTFRPSAIIGDSRIAETTQFDMLRAFSLFAKAPVIPLNPDWRIDIVPADFVSRAVVAIHMKENPAHSIYHLSAGEGSMSYRDILSSLSANARRSKIFAPRWLKPFSWICHRAVHTPHRWGLAASATLIQVFLDHLQSNTVFDNTRITQELGETPASFGTYARDLLGFAQRHRFRYPARPWPAEEVQVPAKKSEIKREVA